MTVTPPLDPELRATLRRLKLGQLVDTLPERLALAKTNKLSHAESSRSCSPMRSLAATPPQRVAEPAPPASTRP